jgi:uncharacterized RDD family membrane protein YckC
MNKWNRLVAAIIDSIIPAIIFIIIFIGGFAGGLFSKKDGDAAGLQNDFGVLGIVILISFVYGIYNLYLEGSTGSSIGKKAMGLKAVNINNKPLGFGGDFVRKFLNNLATGIPWIGTIFALVWFFTINEKGQTISDKWVGAYVIGIKESPAGSKDSNSNDSLSKIESLNELKKSGAISEEEYNSKKEELLKNI